MRTPKRNPKGVKCTSVTSGSPVTTVLLQRRKRGKKPVRVTSGQGLYRSRDFVTSGQKAQLGLHMRRKYFQTRNVTDVTSGHLTNVTSGHVTNVTSGHVTSGCTTAQLHRKYGLRCDHILLPRFTLNIVENGVKHYKSNQSNYIKCTRVRT